MIGFCTPILEIYTIYTIYTCSYFLALHKPCQDGIEVDQLVQEMEEKGLLAEIKKVETALHGKISTE